MAKALKDSYGPDVPERIAAMIQAVEPSFPTEAFLAETLAGYEALELTPRARRIAAALARSLPDDYPSAVDLLVHSLGPPLERTEGFGMAPFLYMPHVLYVAEHGLADFDASMSAQHAITQRFTCELSIRAFLAAEPERTLAVLERWTGDPSVHVRRLVSEGTRPRLPWAPRLRGLIADPEPIVPLLTALRDDPEEYVRRSVANNLNDISKDHADLVVAIAEEWMTDGAGDERRRLVRHALRTLTKAGDPRALALLGFWRDAPVVLEHVEIEPRDPVIGGSVLVTAVLRNAGAEAVPVRAELLISFVKARGERTPRIFRMGEAEIAPGASLELAKRVSLRQHSTRTHYPGAHGTEVLVNGVAWQGPGFDLRPA